MRFSRLAVLVLAAGETAGNGASAFQFPSFGRGGGRRKFAAGSIPSRALSGRPSASVAGAGSSSPSSSSSSSSSLGMADRPTLEEIRAEILAAETE
eukprot:CAMPEP_0113546082 /NCGR_PEP_ID=MMETSP0015_2-20120614/11613_1 /TAXON_ID=2838 /ORGANISM="Odontella" /LENGTH=95 /DNA_ID=CAMNT_0000446507 /DNA_START=213 /DNA_END=497 /DNA_ORIENTATION=- /assembly_acc=CAM_ASM_000160